MKKTLLLFFFFTLLNSCFSQSFKALVKAGDQAYGEKDYYAAMFYYADALERKPENTGLNFKYAEVARQFNAFEQAERHYRKVLRSQEKNAYPGARYWLGIVYKQMGAYEKAIETLGNFIEEQSLREPDLTAKASAEIENCRWALELTNHPEPVKVEQLNRRINTPYSEFGALKMGDTLYYSSFRFEKEGDKNKPPRRITKVLYSIRGSKGRTMRRNFNDDQRHTAHTAMGLDGSRIYFTICDYVNGPQIRCAIYYREKDRRNRWSSKAIKLPEEINREGFTTTHPSIGYDSTLQSEVLFFASDRTGTAGGLDLWWTKVEEGDNKFSRPTHLTVLSTPEDDLTPFFYTAEQTLYFSSGGRQGMGGYDIYKSEWDGSWGAIEHLGHPINTSYNDVYFSMDAAGKSAYLSSNRPGSFYLDRENKACCNDIYQVRWIEPASAVQDSSGTSGGEVVEGRDDPLTEEKTEPEMPRRLEDFLPLALYFDNDEPDKRTRRTTTKKTYEETFEKYYRQKEVYSREYAEPLPEDDRITAEEQMEVFFEEDIRRGYDHLFRFSEILLERLQEGQEVEIFIKGFTSPRAKSDYNLALGQRRISSLQNHFQTYEDGIFQAYLESGKLKITERSFGEATASAEVSDELEDLRNSVYSIGAAKERRVEIVEIKRSE